MSGRISVIALGIDPGKNGAAAIVGPDGPIEWIEFGKSTETDIAEWFHEHVESRPIPGLIEFVSASPQMGVTSAFKFGRSYGFLRALLCASAVRWDDITPAKWQTAMRCRTKGDKNVTKAAAQRLFPGVKITHAVADAFLIAEYARRSSQ